MEQGWIKIHRKLLEWEWYQDANTKIVFLHLLLVANYENGEMQTTIKDLAVELRLSVQEIRTALNHLQSTEEITITPTNKFTKIKINKWECYQVSDKSTNKSTNKITNKITNKNEPKAVVPQGERETENIKSTSTSTNTSTRTSTNKSTNLHIIKENKEYIRIAELCVNLNIESEELVSALRDFSDMRKAIKKPLTERALVLNVKKLLKMSNGDEQKAIKIVEQSIMNNWQGFYELNEKDRYSFIDNW